MKHRLLIPLLTLGLCTVLTAADTQEVQAHHGRRQPIAAPQSVYGYGYGYGYGSHHAYVHVNELEHHPEEHIYYNHVPARGECLMINPGTYPASVRSGVSADIPEDAITEDRARSIALAHAGLEETDVVYLYSMFDYDDGVPEYDVEFCTGSRQYDYEINALDGSISEYDYEIEGGHHHTMSGDTITPPAGSVTEAEAVNAALTHAGVRESDVSFMKVRLDYDEGVLEYDVEFYAGSTEYDYEIDAATGRIQSYDSEIDEDFNPAESGSSAALSETDARNLVLAKIPGASVSDIREFALDKEAGKLIYEGEAVYGGKEYEFEIDAATGAFLDWDVDEED